MLFSFDQLGSVCFVVDCGAVVLLLFCRCGVVGWYVRSYLVRSMHGVVFVSTHF